MTMNMTTIAAAIMITADGLWNEFKNYVPHFKFQISNFKFEISTSIGLDQLLPPHSHS